MRSQAEIVRLTSTRDQTSKLVIQKKASLEKAVQLHTEPKTIWFDSSTYGKLVKSLLVEEKVIRHKAFFEIQPLRSVSFVENEIKRPLRAIFDPKHYSVQIKATQSTVQQINGKAKEVENWFKEDVFNSFFSHWNGFGVIDKLEDDTINPYIVGIENVIDYEFNEKHELDWLFFKRGKNKVFVDADVFAVWEEADNVNPDSIIKHGYGLNPAFKLFDTKGFLAKELGELNYAQFKCIENRNLDLYSSAPVMWTLEDKCSFTEVANPEGDIPEYNYCEGGQLYFEDAPIGRECPRCSKSKLNGVGTVIRARIADFGEKFTVPFGMVFPDSGNLEYNKLTANDLFEGIKERLIGNQSSGDENGQAYNEKQVSAMLEQRRVVLTEIAKIFDWCKEAIYKRVAATFLKNIPEITISSGNEFFSHSQNERWLMYDEAKNNESSINMVESLYDEWAQVKNRNNALGYMRDKMIADLHPFFHYTDAYVSGKYSSGLITEQDMVLRVNFNEVLCEHELSEGRIEDNPEKDYKVKIDGIKAKLIEIVKNKFKHESDIIGIKESLPGGQEGEHS